MATFSDHVMLSRLQFAFTTMFHITWPLLSIGLSIFLVVTESLWLLTKNPAYYHHTRFWSKLFILNFVVGVASGLPLEFQFGTNWSRFAIATHGFFGNILGFEGTMAFMLEAAFLGIMIFGWRQVSPRVHLFATCMVALGASLSAFWIMVANSWMQTPAGGTWVGGRYVMEHYWQGIFSPDLPWGFGHMWVACLETTLFVVGGISAWYILTNRHIDFFLKSFKIAFLAAILIAPLQYSLMAALAQGFVLGGVLGGLPVSGDTFAGGVWSWVTPFTLLVSVGLVCGYMLLGAAYLVAKTEGDMQQHCRDLASMAAFLAFILALGAIIWSWYLYPPLLQKWRSWPSLWITTFPALLAVLTLLWLLNTLRTGKIETAPYILAVLFFACALVSLAGSLYPLILPPAVTIEAAASSPLVLEIMLLVMIPLLPVMLIYNAYQYRVFRGKAGEAGYGEEYMEKRL